MSALTDIDYMKMCLKLSEQALKNGDPPVGAILVVGDEVVGQGIESGRTTNDITNHAEILAIKDAMNKGFQNSLAQARMYTTHEPCLMCAYVIRHHKVAEIIYGTSVEHIGGHTSGFPILSTEDVPKWKNAPKITSGICQKDCDKLTEEFVRSINR